MRAGFVWTPMLLAAIDLVACGGASGDRLANIDGTGGSGGVDASSADAGNLPTGIDAGPLMPPLWDWAGVVGTGQSLSVGTPPITSTTQPYNNLKLSLAGVAVPPWDPSNAAFTMVPLTEPIRSLATGYPAPYPGNVYGETPHSAMANEI